MDNDDASSRGRAGSSAAPNGRASLYQLDSNQSTPSVFEDVEMAHEEVRGRPFHRRNSRPLLIVFFHSSSPDQLPKVFPRVFLPSHIAGHAPTRRPALPTT